MQNSLLIMITLVNFGQSYCKEDGNFDTKCMIIYLIFGESDSERGRGTLDTCVTGARPRPSWKTGSRINYHQSGDELLEYIITNMNNILPCTELTFIEMRIIHLKMCLTLGFSDFDFDFGFGLKPVVGELCLAAERGFVEN